MFVICTFDARYTYICISYITYVGIHYNVMNNWANYRDRKVYPAIVPSGESI